MFITRICMWWGEVFSLTGWSVRGEVFVKSTSWVTVPMAPLNNYFVVHVKKKLDTIFMNIWLFKDPYTLTPCMSGFI